MGDTLIQKIIRSHLVSGNMTPGEDVFIRVDQTLTHDINAVMTYLAFEAIGRGGNLPCALNAANEAAVAAYLEDKIGFYDIAAVAADTLACTEFVAEPSLDDIFATNEEAFARARKQIW